MISDWFKTLPHYILPKSSLTTVAGCVAHVTTPWIKNYIIQTFIKKYHINMDEALISEPTAYTHFNDFFTRRLKADARPLACADIISPVDGYVSELGTIQQGQLLQAKGRVYSVQELLNTTNKALSNSFHQGKFATLYLSPKDYHRVHLPMAAQLQSMTYIPGALFSVQPLTARTVTKLFARNERLVIYFDTAIGPMAMVMVGATIVGAIGTTWHGDVQRVKNIAHFDYSTKSCDLAQGDEIGYFKLGSTVILLFANGQRMQWNSLLASGQAIRFGQALGTICV